VTGLASFLESEIAAGSFPGAAALVGSAGSIREEAFAGFAAVEPARTPLQAETRFDLASLTKPLVTGALVRLAVAQGMSLTDVPGRYLPEWKKTRYEGITLEMLLTHTSGLPDWYPLYVRGEGRNAYRRTLAEIEPQTAPGSAVVYSDLGFLAVGEILEVFFSSPLERCFAGLVAAPAGSEARFLPPSAEACAATEKGDRAERNKASALGLSYGGFREGVVRGEVHDGNALRCGGVAGHAGLFATAKDVWKLSRGWLDPSAASWTADRTPDLAEARGLSWQGRRGAGSAVPEFSDSAFGHTGFTGTSVWLDPGRERVFVLLTNRIHPEAKDVNFNDVRRRFHRAALEREA
jgi:serine-type D-Ala-D-Ala carboxypeptidase